jgi:hypothetical protein
LAGWNDIVKGDVILKSEAGNVTFDLPEALGQVFPGDNGMWLEMIGSWQIRKEPKWILI